ncbi:hypothetical protein [Micromonospora sp. RV43]|uniref:hypothetical protein n=1 Tax=Micromonospora sp. RV43 TaxID=1661387 RepID=UPI00064C2469|nr:hypothetical protein [Micromonospora sp. RV43]
MTVPVPQPSNPHARHDDHSLLAVRAEFEGWDKVPRSWVRMARRGCEHCAQWDAVKARISATRRAYGRRNRRRSR